MKDNCKEIAKVVSLLIEVPLPHSLANTPCDIEISSQLELILQFDMNLTSKLHDGFKELDFRPSRMLNQP
jgi:hypothetical protein